MIMAKRNNDENNYLRAHFSFFNFEFSCFLSVSEKNVPETYN